MSGPAGSPPSRPSSGQPSIPPAVEGQPQASHEGQAPPPGLPPAAPGLAGSTLHNDHNYKLSVSNANGYLAHIMLESEWQAMPETLFAIFTYPDNSALFRDIKRVGNRRVVKSSPGLKVIDVEQIGELKILWMKRGYSTWLHVTEDARDEENLSIQFDLQKSDVLAKFSGHWSLVPVRDAATGAVVGCKGLLRQDVLPNGVPLFLQRVPVLGRLLRGISVRAIKRLMEDINAAVSKVAKGAAAGQTVQQVLNTLCGPVKAEEGYANGVVKSFAIDDCYNDCATKIADEADEADGEAQSLSVRIEVCGAVHVRLHLSTA